MDNHFSGDVVADIFGTISFVLTCKTLQVLLSRGVDSKFMHNAKQQDTISQIYKKPLIMIKTVLTANRISIWYEKV